MEDTVSLASVADVLSLVFDPGSVAVWDEPVADPPGLPDAYVTDLARARAGTGLDEGVLTGRATLRGRPVAFIAGEARFLGGSIGVSSAERLTRGIERATSLGLPLVAFPVGGGTRMQEGTRAFLQMAKITQAVMAHKAAHLPYLVYLRHPTMGGVFASWASLGHVSIGEPGAMLGFLGPRVYEALYGSPFPAGVQVAENLHDHGIIDDVVAPAELADELARILTVIHDTHPAVNAADDPASGALGAVGAPASAWASISITRTPGRPGVRDLLRVGATDVTMLSGTGDGESHPGSVLALGRFGGVGCVVLGQCREGQRVDRPLDAAALRQARRGLRLSRELDLPLVTVIDTPGGALSKEAEERGLGGEIARTLSELLTLPTPTVSLLMGQGTGGIALALVPADRVIASEHAWLAPLPPEGASAIVHRDTTHAAELAEAQGVRASDLAAEGIVDRIVAEPTDAVADADAFCRGLSAAIAAELVAVTGAPAAARLAARQARYRALGTLS